MRFRHQHGFPDSPLAVTWLSDNAEPYGRWPNPSAHAKSNSGFEPQESVQPNSSHPPQKKLSFITEVFSINTSRSSATTGIITVGTVPLKWTEIGYTVQRFITSWKVLGSNPAAGEIFRQFPDRPWGPTIFPYNGYRACLPELKLLGVSLISNPISRRG